MVVPNPGGGGGGDPGRVGDEEKPRPIPKLSEGGGESPEVGPVRVERVNRREDPATVRGEKERNKLSK